MSAAVGDTQRDNIEHCRSLQENLQLYVQVSIVILVLSISSKQERGNEKKRGGGRGVSQTPSRPSDTGMNSTHQIQASS